ncbi:hypothetical protein AKG11_07785 [Shinella sp. SUS2]|uniref:hypothetical protein n=1 Tax=unclassified Shinella TaxID=2643062 RepID=UPI000682E540|nr:MULTISPECIES: hypothetical protein [unclassified Shinella]KNY17533.1 hypothetical protein AKG11_07785 [Shinella sp. SUS2]KOC74995.1 hypothetical protein AKG10_13530 [Shinella sp. GWS1]
MTRFLLQRIKFATAMQHYESQIKAVPQREHGLSNSNKERGAFAGTAAKELRECFRISKTADKPR